VAGVEVAITSTLLPQPVNTRFTEKVVVVQVEVAAMVSRETTPGPLLNISSPSPLFSYFMYIHSVVLSHPFLIPFNILAHSGMIAS